MIRKGEPLDAHVLAKRLRKYGIAPKPTATAMVYSRAIHAHSLRTLGAATCALGPAAMVGYIGYTRLQTRRLWSSKDQLETLGRCADAASIHRPRAITTTVRAPGWGATGDRRRHDAR